MRRARVFANAGVSTGEENTANVRRTFDTNALGVVNTCPMPFFMEADRAARTILRRADRNVGLIAFPWPMRLGAWALSVLPWRANELLNRLLPKKVI